MKALKHFLPLFFFFLFHSYSSAQLDNPIAGDVMKLLDLLHKDYTTVDDAVKAEELRRDRGEVIGIFKKYLSVNKRDSIPGTSLDTEFTNLDSKKKEIEDLEFKIESIKESMELMKNVTYNDARNLGMTPSALEDNKESLRDLKQELVDLYEKIDTKLLDSIRTKFSSNEYLKYEIGAFKNKYAAVHADKLDDYASSKLQISTQKSLPFIGGNFDLQTLIDGLSRFIADRMKAELTNAFISKVQNWMKTNDDEELMAFKILMPKTTKYVLSFDANDLNYFTTTIKDNLEIDFNHLIHNIGGLRALPSIQLEIQNNPELEFAFEAVEFIPQLKKIKHPNEYFIFLNNSSLVREWASGTDTTKKDIANGIKFTTLMANSLTVKESSTTRFISAEEVSKYYNDLNFFMLFIGLLDQQNSNYYDVEFGSKKLSTVLTKLSGTNLEPSILESTPQKVEFLFTRISNITNESQKIAQRIQDIKKASKLNEKIGKDTIIELIRNFVDFFDNTAQNIDEIAMEFNNETREVFESKTRERLSKYLTIADHSVNILDNLFHKRYANSILEALEVVTLIDGKNGTRIRSIGNLMKNALTYKPWNGIHDTLTSGNAYTIDKNLKKRTAELSKILEETNVLSRNEGKYKTTSKLIDTALMNLKVIESSTIGTALQIDTLIFSKLITDKNFPDLFIQSQFPLIEWNDFGKNMKKLLCDLEYKGNKLFKKDSVQVISGRLNTLHKAIFSYAYLNNPVDLQSFRKDFTTYTLNPLLIEATKNSSLDPRLKRFIYFINDMGNAQDAEQVQAALENFALPVGSYSIKRKSCFNMSIGTTPGVLYSFSEKSQDTVSLSTGVGFTAPVGINLSWGLGRGWSLGVFAPIIDIGALTHYRLDSNNDTDPLPEVSFRNILTFGAQVQIGIPKSPLIASIGWQRGPQIRKVDASAEGGFRSVDSSRWSVGLMVDIPIFNIYTSTK